MSANTGLQPQAFWKSSFRDRYDIWAIKREIVRFEHHTVICRSSIHSTVGQNSKIYEKNVSYNKLAILILIFQIFSRLLAFSTLKIIKMFEFYIHSIKKVTHCDNTLCIYLPNCCCDATFESGESYSSSYLRSDFPHESRCHIVFNVDVKSCGIDCGLTGRMLHG